MLGRQLDRIHRSRLLDLTVVATSTKASDDPVANYCRERDMPFFRGSLDDVLSRFVLAEARFGPAEHIVRITADCPLIDWLVIDECIALHKAKGFDFTSNTLQRTFPIGLDVEVMTSDTLYRLDSQSKISYQREHVTQLVYDRPDEFRCGHYKQKLDESKLRWTVDTADDFSFVNNIYEHLLPYKEGFTTQDIRQFLDTQHYC